MVAILEPLQSFLLVLFSKTECIAAGRELASRLPSAALDHQNMVLVAASKARPESK